MGANERLKRVERAADNLAGAVVFFELNSDRQTATNPETGITLTLDQLDQLPATKILLAEVDMPPATPITLPRFSADDGEDENEDE